MDSLEKVALDRGPDNREESFQADEACGPDSTLQLEGQGRVSVGQPPENHSIATDAAHSEELTCTQRSGPAVGESGWKSSRLQPCVSGPALPPHMSPFLSLLETVFPLPSLTSCFLCDSVCTGHWVGLVGFWVPLYATLSLRDPALLN